MKIIITGATGSLGANLTRYFSEKGHEIIACGRDKQPPKKLLEYGNYFHADITKPFELPEADICIHAAAMSDDHGEREKFFQANVTGTEHVINAASSCHTFIHISSSAVYLPEDEPINENIAGHQNNRLLSEYGASKLASEKKVHEKSQYVKCFILRPRALYGEGDKKILPRMLKLVKNNKIYSPGKMEVNVSMTHYKNMAHAIECCINSSLTGIHTYNVADEKSYILIDVLRKICGEIYGKTLPEKQIPINLLKFMSFMHLGGISPLLIRSLTKNMVLDISKIKDELNYSPVMDIDRSLTEIGKWVKNIGGAEVLKRAERILAWEI